MALPAEVKSPWWGFPPGKVSGEVSRNQWVWAALPNGGLGGLSARRFLQVHGFGPYQVCGSSCRVGASHWVKLFGRGFFWSTAWTASGTACNSVGRKCRGPWVGTPLLQMPGSSFLVGASRKVKFLGWGFPRDQVLLVRLPAVHGFWLPVVERAPPKPPPRGFGGRQLSRGHRPGFPGNWGA